MSYTPGPWTVEKDIRISDGAEYVAGLNIVSEHGEIVGCEGIYDQPNNQENAMLIAAAPEILDALEWALSVLSPTNEIDMLKKFKASELVVKLKGLK